MMFSADARRFMAQSIAAAHEMAEREAKIIEQALADGKHVTIIAGEIVITDNPEPFE